MTIAFFLFVVLGWSYYMVATILMRGSIFAGMRMYIEQRATTSCLFDFLRDMLGCLMCTATEAAIWTLGVATFGIGFHYRIVSHIVSLASGERVVLPTGVEIVLALLSAFALSLAVAGEAWAIKTVVEHREQKFLKLREEFRAREVELLGRITELETAEVTDKDFSFDLN